MDEDTSIVMSLILPDNRHKTYYFKNNPYGAGEMAQQIQVLAAQARRSGT